MGKVQKQPSLLICILLDFIGFATYTIPGLGELADLVWAPVSAVIFFKLFGGWKGAAGGVFNFIEELMPGLDFIPSFNIMCIFRSLGKTQTTRSIQPI